ncbi:uncharacterized protein PV07_09750 [Cladophialophora immunda]|uniref:Mid2 domain-containing protein n=1 Tax=Cladophialophora immunda TaxID=569365 RepID=A0A0D1Z8R8_9EURO|nr:uncharacterized protein PV07_09750 [Cladophialophora immunda]KIW24011.1 hypothetical protein PV07_09750 [Cladophialophora immunda]OQV01856.1 hypothetical protein CLAIMM_07147 [Cladophialophora immunda]
MLQEGLFHHVRRAAQMHPHPDFTSNAEPVTASTSLASSTTESSTTSSSSAIATTAPTPTTDMAPHAAFLYPTEVMTLNNIDVIQVSYQTVWNNVDLSIFCELSPGSDQFALANVNQIQSNGTYAIAPIQAGMQIPHYPTYCNFMLCDAQNKTDSTTAAGFTMVSTQGIATTYALAATRAATSSATQTPTGSEQAPTATGVANLSSSPGASAAAETAVSSASHTTGIGNGAKAGIAIGVILGIIALITAIFFCLRKRRQLHKIGDMVTLRSTASSVDIAAPSEKVAVADSAPVSTAALPSTPSPDNDGSPVTGFKMGENHRNSEDWRRFFGNGKTQKPAASP